MAKSLTQATLFLMNQKGLAVLQALIQEGFQSEICEVYSHTDSNLLCGSYQSLKALCEDHRISFRDTEHDPIRPFSFGVAVGWRWLIRDELILGDLIVFHDSLLPRYRGFAPLVTALLNKEPSLGVTALRASSRYDKGPIVAQAAISISYPVRLAQAIDRITPLYQELVLKVFKQNQVGQLPAGETQDESQASYSLWRDEKDYEINWKQSSTEIAHFVKCVGFPYAGASAQLRGSSGKKDQKVRILDAEVETGVKFERIEVGKVFSIDGGFPRIVCQDGNLLKITDLVDDQTRQSLLPLQKLKIRFS